MRHIALLLVVVVVVVNTNRANYRRFITEARALLKSLEQAPMKRVGQQLKLHNVKSVGPLFT